MKRAPVVWSSVVVAACLLGPRCADAVIKIEFPVTRMYADSKTVRSAVVISVDAGSGMVEAKPNETFKGGPAPAKLRILIVAPADAIRDIAVAQPVAIFARETEGQGAAIVHIADTWLLAQGVPDATPPTLRVVQPYDAKRAFPGRTASLVRLLAALKAGTAPLADKIDPACLAGTAREVANLGLKTRATFLEAADLNGDGRPDLLVGTADGVRLFLGAEQGYSDATAPWGLQGLRAEHAAVGDVDGDGQPDALLGAALLMKQGDRFARAETALDLPPESEWLAVAVADATGDRKADIAVLRKTGELLVLQNPGAAGKPWPRVSRKLWEGGAAAAARFSTDWGETEQLQVMVARGGGITRYAAAADAEPGTPFPQLTGATWPPALALDDQPAGTVQCVALDCDGNGKLDLMLLAPGGGVTLLNRGFGSFWVDNTIQARLRPQDPKTPPFVVTPGALLAGGARQRGERPRQNLLVLTQDGRLYEVPNLPPSGP